ncbi:MAG: XRE family transcriptional regulator [Candidatus Jettenia sp.]|uniref:helix-turn-helix transcriptional regulator n=1 Tax=Candidatus Jettenia sp. AMX1 TaxID=2293637 RepID=UPI0013F6DC6A|nr:MAG: XRE family transcriptional regulator [Candidatus Jettenia sp. AMX1]MBC6930568.1 XRE family transcriptional regulator [Candidatus Jettenia sp.]MCE7882172.1 XRE family transcriptional regulator [Candidatus Jettenia sp. AMX1]MCQ3928689.1 hypothetical protein [Candidatus Jettenia sp.]MDL1940579.1 helix-turn-helix transcriptional regulator [Candidatus Jettenia sp. AMX1]
MLGKHIKFLREKAELSQAQMSELLRVSPRAIARFEAKGHAPVPRIHIIASCTSSSMVYAGYFQCSSFRICRNKE